PPLTSISFDPIDLDSPLILNEVVSIVDDNREGIVQQDEVDRATVFKYNGDVQQFRVVYWLNYKAADFTLWVGQQNVTKQPVAPGMLQAFSRGTFRSGWKVDTEHSRRTTITRLEPYLSHAVGANWTSVNGVSADIKRYTLSANSFPAKKVGMSWEVQSVLKRA